MDHYDEKLPRRREMPWRWTEGAVDPDLEHLELHYGNGLDSPGSWKKIAMVGKPDRRVFPVTWLVDRGSPEAPILLQVAKQDLDFYLLDVGGHDPWGYALYHCCWTSADLYSMVHWSYVKGNKTSRLPPNTPKNSPE